MDGGKFPQMKKRHEGTDVLFYRMMLRTELSEHLSNDDILANTETKRL